MKTCAFTGHRPQKLKFLNSKHDERYLKLKQRIKKICVDLIDNHDVRIFLSGMALGVDMLAAEVVLELRAVYPDISLECILPCENQAEKWHQTERDRYNYILSQCDRQITLQKLYTDDCMIKRNRYMIDYADFLVAVWNRQPGGGTGYTVRYAQSLGVPVVVIDPREFI